MKRSKIPSAHSMHSPSTSSAQPFFFSQSTLILLIIVSLICLLLQFEPFAAATEWHLYRIKSGQWWRVFTGNFTHSNFIHLAMNVAALWVMAFVFKPEMRQLLLVIFFTSLGVGVGLFLSPIGIYVGFSGTLHGIFAYFALQETLHGRRTSALLVFGIIAKVIWEQIFGAPSNTSELINSPVAIDAHLAGMIAGFVLQLAQWGWQRQLKTK